VANSPASGGEFNRPQVANSPARANSVHLANLAGFNLILFLPVLLMMPASDSMGNELISRWRRPMPLTRLVDSGSAIQPPPDVQRTTMSLDVLGRFVCSTWDEAVGNGGAPFDAVIVGAGMFGGYCADKISRGPGARPLRVLVLEAGSFLVPTHVQNLPRPHPITETLVNLFGVSHGGATWTSLGRPTV
jgi:hypothetical protein